MKFRILLYFVLFINVSLSANDTLGFVSPVDHQIRLTGNFMELRPNHFHAGIDIKSSKGVPGDLVRATQDGYISRIRITSGSYGNALYIDHPNGFTSVYAHLESFIPEVKEYLSEVQYEVQSFEVDIYLPDSLLVVKKSQEIGKMGNSGRSFGPHLHFEIRETKTEMPRNPEELGIGPEDNKPPSLQSLYVYGLGENNELLDTDIRYFKSSGADPQLHSKLVETENDKVGLGLQMFDTMNGSSNKNGVYGYKVFVDNNLSYAWEAEVFSFSDNKKINGFIDFQKQKALGLKVYLLYKQFCNALNDNSNGDGVIYLDEGQTKEIRIEVYDLYNNHAHLEFNLKRKGNKIQNKIDNLDCSEHIELKDGIFSVDFLPESFFTPVKLEIRSGKEEVLGQSCHSISIAHPHIAVNKYFKISCPIPVDYDQNWTFISTDSKGRFLNFGADTVDNKMVCWADQLGKYFVYSDRTAPTAKIINLEASMKRPWKIQIKDNLNPDGRVNNLVYKATVNGQWILMKYDLKNDMLIFDDFEKIPSLPIDFQLVVSDDSGNTKTLKKTIR